MKHFIFSALAFLLANILLPSIIHAQTLPVPVNGPTKYERGCPEGLLRPYIRYGDPRYQLEWPEYDTRTVYKDCYILSAKRRK
jgi:hypothetical protein